MQGIVLLAIFVIIAMNWRKFPLLVVILILVGALLGSSH